MALLKVLMVVWLLHNRLTPLAALQGTHNLTIPDIFYLLPDI